ncbi:UvrD-helicase domain-containing protein [Methylacidiphilum caldifontis]|uniref:UvrD-helicase domain-containing protein n=1 Tax=Methylacidiphilum caldifontis TaxID=2795386 RepID=UPI001A8F461B|nr:UvrD-helicase domain-containing protein [Methylacidiphilum caldifontis]QSR89126.1 UvrD-helicase domain-containing protein [Methylacidiphilum caldifontis]
MNREKQLDHLIVVASAGVGKTHKLVERVLELLMGEILPHSLVVITFTKKAAQEIVDRLFSTLAKLAVPLTDREGIEPDLFSQNKKACRALKMLIEHLPSLHFQTIDSFFYFLLNYIPLDKRTSFARFSILDEKAKKTIQVELIRNVLSSKEFDPSFVDNFKVFLGDDLKTIFSNYLSLVQKYYPYFSDFPSVDLWGDPRLVTSNEETIKDPAFLSLLDEIGSYLKSLDMPTKTWEEQKLKINSLPRLYQNVLKAYDPQTAQCDQITLERKKYPLAEPLASALGKLAEKTIDYFIEKSHRRTRAVAHLLSVYDLYYRKSVTNQGFCSFEDIPRIILEATGLNSSYPFLYNLDQKWNHFLIDEFQDTSLLQWKVIKLFVDELIQYQDGSRSFFCVGDPKQSIYGWRGACSELIDSVESQYKLKREELIGSRRSSKAILDFVNMIFGNFEVIDKLLPESLEKWKKRWVDQQAMDVELEGYSCFLCVETAKKEKNGENFVEENGEEEETDNCISLYEALEKLLVEEIKPQERHLSCAILVQTNRKAEAIFQHLSLCPSLRVSLEGKLYPGKDSLIGKLFFALVQALAHPGDSLALGWLRSTPFGSVFQDEVSWRKAFWKVFFLEGFEGLAFQFFSLLQQAVVLDDFHKERMEMILQICQAFDKTGSRNFERFLSHYKDFSLPLSEDPSSVQVRTVHSAKGLEFDVVIVTELLGRETAMNKPRDVPIAYTSSRGESKLFFLPRKEIAEKEPQLSCLYEELVAEEQLEKLSLLYVAMTRARQGLYIVGEIQQQTNGKNSTRQSVYWQDLLLEGLGTTSFHRNLFFPDYPLVTLFETGKREWNPRPKKEFFKLEEKKEAKSQDFPYPPRPLSRTQFVSPSTLEPNAQELNLYSLFSLDKGKRIDHGLIVHKIFSQIERLSEDILFKLKQKALEYGQKDKERNPFKEVLDCLQSPSIKEIFTPKEETKIWIERSFCVEVEGQWVRGTLDRVHVEKDLLGNVQCSIYDFKTDAISLDKKEELVKKYLSQLILYRKALCQLLDIDSSRIKVFLVSVFLKEVMAL